MEWSDHGQIQIQGQFGDLMNSQKAVIEVNRIVDQQITGLDLEESDEPSWVVMSIKQVPDPAQVKPSDFFKNEEDESTQSFLTGSGWVAVIESDRHYGLLLVQ